MRSVAVVFPASICAMIPMFRQRFNGTWRATLFPQFLLLFPAQAQRPRLVSCFFLSPEPYALSPVLPAIVRERLVRLSHAMHVFLLLHRRAAAIGRVQQFRRELVDHALLAPRPSVAHQPANRQRRAPLRVHFNRNLIVRAAHAPRLYFQQRLAVLHRLLEQRQSVTAALLLQLRHRGIDNALRRRLLAAPHHRVHKLRNQCRAVNRVGCDLTLGDMTFSRHKFLISLQQQTYGCPILDRRAAHGKGGRRSPTFWQPPWRASRHTSTGSASASPRPPNPVFREQCDTARP